MFVLVKNVLRSKPELYFLLKSKQLREALIVEGYSPEALKGLKKPKLWKMFTGLDKK